MKKLKQLSLLSSSLCLVLILLACRKDKVPNLSCGNETNVNTDSIACEDFTYPESSITLQETRTDTQYMEPCFSPFTDDEFIYVRRVAGVSAPEIVKYTISSKSEQVLCTTDDTGGFPLGSPEWGKQNKIIFSVGTGNSGIGYLINDDGGDLQQFLPSNVNFIHPKFNGDGSEVFATGSAFNGVSGLMNPIYDLNANIVDSIHFYFDGSVGVGSPASFDGEIKNGIFSFADLTKDPDDKGIGYIESDTTFNPIISTNNPTGYGVTDIDKYQDLIYYVIYGLGFYQYNETTGATTLLQEMCDSRKIIYISVSQISGNILIEEMNNTKLSEFGGVDIQSNIYLLNPYTMEKTPILVE
jgi:hypothetical protein